ncbi:MAG: SRPBCC domain-containing protein [Thermodesulfobacteriota bacterium]
MKEVFSEIEIQAPAEHVWQVLTDFASYPEWNPFIHRISGQPKEGTRLKVYIEPPGAKGRTFHPKILKAQPNCELRWLGRLLIPGLFDGDHFFSIEHLGRNRVRFVQREIFSGLLVSFFTHGLDMNIRLGFEQMNQALKLQAEQGRLLPKK